ncbi:hypothetical protein OPQ81_010516 [Rhizoctonia solani]|nr:hypothetical protein OPQ81_010516 [Rhizoctonia solani]
MDVYPRLVYQTGISPPSLLAFLCTGGNKRGRFSIKSFLSGRDVTEPNTTSSLQPESSHVNKQLHEATNVSNLLQLSAQPASPMNSDGSSVQAQSTTKQSTRTHSTRMSLAVPIQECISPQNLQQTAVDTLSSHTGSNGPSLAAQSAPRQNSQGSLAAGVTPTRTKFRNLVAGIARPTADALKFGPLQDLSDLIKDFANMHVLDGTIQKEHEELQQRLWALLKFLYEHWNENTSPIMVGKVQDIREFIERELGSLRNKQGGKQLGRLLAANEEEEKLAACCRRVQEYLDQLLLDNTLAIHKMEEEQSKARIGRLPSSPSAWYDSNAGAELNRRECTPGTRVIVLEKILEWTRKKHEGGVYWLNGMAGTGKTTIAYSVCKRLDAENKLAASFFCSRLRDECRNVNLIIPSIAYQLAHFSPPFQHALSSILEEDQHIEHKTLDQQFDVLIKKPLLTIKSVVGEEMVVVIDALDECENKDSTMSMLGMLLSKSTGLPLRFIVSSRPEPQIRDQMTEDRVGSRLVLHELDRGAVQTDVERYIRDELKHMKPAPEEDQISALVKRAGILFIYASTVVRYIGYDNFQSDPHGRLCDILNGPESEEDVEYEEIDQLYVTVLDAALGNRKLRKVQRDMMQQVLHTVICAREPLTVVGLSGLLQIDNPERVREVLRPLWSVLYIVEGNELVTTLHASFPDFMLESTRSKKYHCDSEAHNRKLAELCFTRIERTRPQFNICQLDSSHLPDHSVPDIKHRVEEAISSELLYACRYWADHVQAAKCSSSMVEQLLEFLSKRLLLWMEVLNLKGQMKAGMECMKLTAELCNRLEGQPELGELDQDAKRFVEAFALNPVSQSTAHIYVSMLTFWPRSRPMAKHYARFSRGPVKAEGTGLDRRQQAHLSTWAFEKKIYAMSVSPDGFHIALRIGEDVVVVVDSSSGRTVLGSNDKTVRFWDAENGKMLHCLSVQDEVNSVVFSPDGTRVAASSRKTLYVWDTQTGHMTLSPLTHTDYITSVAFSADSSRIVGDTYGDSFKIHVSDAQSGHTTFGPIQAHTNGIPCIGCSPDGKYIVSGSHYRTIRIWDAQNGNMILGPLEAHTGEITSVAFSPDSSRIISACEGGLVCTWDVEQPNTTPRPINAPSHRITCVKFASDGTYFASGSKEGTICTWDARTGDMKVGPIEAHTDQINAVDILNHRVVSGSYDGTICVCDAVTGQVVLGPLQVRAWIGAVAYSPDGKLIAIGSWNGVDVWDAQNGSRVLDPLTDLDGLVLSVRFSPDGTRIVGGSNREVVRIVVWDVSDGKNLFGSLDGHSGRVRSVSYSPNGALIASGSSDGTIIVWNAYTGEMALPPLTAHSNWVLSVDFSPDSTRLVSSSDDRTIRIWDVQIGEMIFELLHGHENWIRSVEYSPDGTQILSCSDDMSVRIHDARSPDERARSGCQVGDWTMNKDGWVVDDQSRLLVWVPGDLRKALSSHSTLQCMVAPSGFCSSDI